MKQIDWMDRDQSPQERLEGLVYDVLQAVLVIQHQVAEILANQTKEQ